MKTPGRTIFGRNYQIYKVGLRSGEIEEMICDVDNFNIAKAAFEAATKEYTNIAIHLRNKSRVIEVVKTGRYDSKTQTIEIVARLS